jgi:hypothetical protein
MVRATMVRAWHSGRTAGVQAVRSHIATFQAVKQMDEQTRVLARESNRHQFVHQLRAAGDELSEALHSATSFLSP